MLDKAIERSGKAQELKQIEATRQIEAAPPPSPTRPFGPVPDRRYRRA